MPVTVPTTPVTVASRVDGVAQRPSEWLPAAAPVPAGHVLAAAQDLRRSPAEIAYRLTELGYTVPEHRWPDAVTEDDVYLLSRDLDGKQPWLAADAPVPAGHLLAAAQDLQRSPAEIAYRLTEFGAALPDGLALAQSAATDDNEFRGEDAPRRRSKTDAT